MRRLLLTSAGLTKNLEVFFFDKIQKRACDIKVIFVPSASIMNDGAREGISLCIFNLMNMGILEENISVYHLGYLLSKNYTRTYSSEVTDIPPLYRLLSVDELNHYDLLVFSGGDSAILLSEINRTGFDEVIKGSVENGLFYLGVSAGSMVTAGNFPDSLGYIRNEIHVHCKEGTNCGDLPKDNPVYLADTQAIWIEGNSVQIID
ncbi:Type 1 glutamine amidotransferase-like domain-containing protein [Anaerocolumna chitinilytica]|uniref:Peptidase n=1 Tax=Anaerocolumna chitinilytica TaxID=1727145 RepID=A0A7I8DGY6_9FIRM|nr:Type 1 glutamine amidotransferase-like domain-containing protein [Anaerocolumna chitinilytica]BCJ97763.1 hypothetical protein bsdcttw_08040 [Anaerocolumna chitinilytica]